MTTSILRPNATFSNTGALTGGATAHAVTSDDSDASYVTLDNLDETIVRFGTVALPAGSVVVSVTPRARAAYTAGAVALDAWVYTENPSFSSIGSSSTALTASPTTHTLPAIAAALSQTDVDSLAMEIESHTAAALRLYELYLDLLYALKPTAAVSAPTGTVSVTSSPTATWSHTAGSDGGPQSRYRLKVFTAAQYGIGGFDPEVSPFTSDSGEVVGSATSQVIGPLANSTTWRVYVKTAQTVNAAPHWSDWAFSGFTTSFTPPTIASVGVTPDVANARLTVLVTRTVMTPTWIACTVERSDDAGVSWVFVRGATDAAASGTTFTVIDYEAPFATSVIYRARAASADFTGPFVSSSSSSISPTTAWLKDVFNPALNMSVRLRQFPEVQRGIRRGIHQPLGEAYPTVVSDVRQAGTGQTTFQTRTPAEATALQAILARPFVLLQQPPTWDQGNRYVSLGDYTESRLVQKVRPHRHWPVAWTEVVRFPE